MSTALCYLAHPLTPPGPLYIRHLYISVNMYPRSSVLQSYRKQAVINQSLINGRRGNRYGLFPTLLDE